MSTDLKAAADRVRRANAGESPLLVYFPHYETLSREDKLEAIGIAANRLREDCALLANDHPLVKGEPAAGGERCPRCNSPSPELHPAMQHEGEVEICRDPWHGPFDPRMHAPPPAPPADVVDWPTEPGFWIWDSPDGEIPVQASDFYGEIVVYRFAYDFRYEKGGMAGHGFRKLSLTARAGENH